jgi:hypothetical protein
MKALAVALAAVVGLVPVFAQLGYAQAVLESVPVLPVGEAVSDEELQKTEGEVVLKILLVMGLVALATTIEQYFFDEDYGLDWDDGAVIALRTLTVGATTLVGGCGRANNTYMH